MEWHTGRPQRMLSETFLSRDHTTLLSVIQTLNTAARASAGFRFEQETQSDCKTREREKERESSLMHLFRVAMRQAYAQSDFKKKELLNLLQMSSASELAPCVGPALVCP